ncbi:MAG TPA: hypothetical protein P5110_08665 [Candidatus Omnitrophota bacterium]|nr:hypothetical protein [Candidatus Omnitrophota bacterium]HRZ15562.1 hypothetical protein [Candidatus Omnitrophota bacterium]
MNISATMGNLNAPTGSSGNFNYAANGDITSITLSNPTTGNTFATITQTAPGQVSAQLSTPSYTGGGTFSYGDGVQAMLPGGLGQSMYNNETTTGQNGLGITVGAPLTVSFENGQVVGVTAGANNGNPGFSIGQADFANAGLTLSAPTFGTTATAGGMTELAPVYAGQDPNTGTPQQITVVPGANSQTLQGGNALAAAPGLNGVSQSADNANILCLSAGLDNYNVVAAGLTPGGQVVVSFDNGKGTGPQVMGTTTADAQGNLRLDYTTPGTGTVLIQDVSAGTQFQVAAKNLSENEMASGNITPVTYVDSPGDVAMRGIDPVALLNGNFEIASGNGYNTLLTGTSLSQTPAEIRAASILCGTNSAISPFGQWSNPYQWIHDLNKAEGAIGFPMDQINTTCLIGINDVEFVNDEGQVVGVGMGNAALNWEASLIGWNKVAQDAFYSIHNQDGTPNQYHPAEPYRVNIKDLNPAS